MAYYQYSKKPISETPANLGEHLMRCRRERGLDQKQAAALLGVNPFTLGRWETNRNVPRISHWPGIIRFLGYDPTPEPQTLAKRILALRRRLGIARFKLATRLGCDEGVVAKWEWEISEPAGDLRASLDTLIIGKAQTYF
jgi:DNA-binding transcriptional regulator YiaG